MGKKVISAPPPVLRGFVPGARVKGGVAPGPAGVGYVAIIHVWDNIECKGEPREWRTPMTFPTEDKAMAYYKATLRPALAQFMEQLANDKSGVTIQQKRLE